MALLVICSPVVVNGYGRKVFMQGTFVLTAHLLLICIMDVIPTGAANGFKQLALLAMRSFTS
jgi:hypothetical protein